MGEALVIGLSFAFLVRMNGFTICFRGVILSSSLAGIFTLSSSVAFAIVLYGDAGQGQHARFFTGIIMNVEASLLHTSSPNPLIEHFPAYICPDCLQRYIFSQSNLPLGSPTSSPTIWSIRPIKHSNALIQSQFTVDTHICGCK